MSRSVPNHVANLWNSDLLTMRRNPFVGRSFSFRGFTIKEVVVFGVVISVERMKSCVTYYVDDGTGVILCAFDENVVESHHREEICKFMNFYREPENVYLLGSTVLSDMLQRALNVLDRVSNLQEGDSAFILGKICECTEELRVVTISFIYPLDDLRTEILLMECRNKFYQDISTNKVDRSSSQCLRNKQNSDNFSSDSDNSSVDESNKRRKVNKRTIDCCIGEWHEEYFFFREENLNSGVNDFKSDTLVTSDHRTEA